jgi:serine/threonine protein kinase
VNASAPSSDTDPLVELADEYAERFRRGERPSLAEYTDKYPHLADRIRKLFPTLVMMEEFGSVAGPSSDSHLDTGSPPRQLGEYRILREVGRGGMGVVYEAVQESLGRHVALKVLAVQNWKNSTHLERFPGKLERSLACTTRISSRYLGSETRTARTSTPCSSSRDRASTASCMN